MSGFYTLSQKEKKKERLKVKEDEKNRGVLLEKTVLRLREKISGKNKKKKKPKLQEMSRGNLDRCKTAQALHLSPDITLGKLLTVSLAEANEKSKAIYATQGQSRYSKRISKGLGRRSKKALRFATNPRHQEFHL